MMTYVHSYTILCTSKHNTSKVHRGTHSIPIINTTHVCTYTISYQYFCPTRNNHHPNKNSRTAIGRKYSTPNISLPSKQEAVLLSHTSQQWSHSAGFVHILQLNTSCQHQKESKVSQECYLNDIHKGSPERSCICIEKVGHTNNIYFRRLEEKEKKVQSVHVQCRCRYANLRLCIYCA